MEVFICSHPADGVQVSTPPVTLPVTLPVALPVAPEVIRMLAVLAGTK